MWRHLMFVIAILSATAGYSDCRGPSAFDRLPAETRAALHAQADQSPHASGLLWKIEKNGHTSYLVGTLHFPDTRLSDIRDRLAPQMTSTDRLFLEMTLEAEAAFQARLSSDPSLYMITEGPSLIDLLGDDNWEEVKLKLNALGLPGFAVSRYQPWFLGLTLAVPPCAMQSLKDGGLGLDRRLEQVALTEQMDTQSLDTVEGLISIFTADPLDVQVALMKDAIEAGLLGQETDAATIIDLYFQEQVQLIWEHEEHKALAQAHTHGAAYEVVASQMDEVEQELVTKRNLAWLEILAPALAEGSATIAVGALHLPGDTGLLALLEAAGFTVTRLPLIP